MPSRFASVACLLLIGSSAFAHEGHGHPEHTDGVLHYLVNPSHSAGGILAMVAAVAIVVVARKALGKRS